MSLARGVDVQLRLWIRGANTDITGPLIDKKPGLSLSVPGWRAGDMWHDGLRDSVATHNKVQSYFHVIDTCEDVLFIAGIGNQIYLVLRRSDQDAIWFVRLHPVAFRGWWHELEGV